MRNHQLPPIRLLVHKTIRIVQYFLKSMVTLTLTKVDRRIIKSQEAIKKAFIVLLSEKNFDEVTIQEIADKANVGRRTVYLHYLDKFDLLDKIIGEHINELRKICNSASDLNFVDGNLLWFEYFERNSAFFSSMFSSKAAPSFRSHLLEFVIEELKIEVNNTEGKNEGLSKDLIFKFFGAGIVEIIEAWFTNGLSEPTQVVAEQMGILLDRNL
jgi:AcrR family transcriptional regulator